MNETPTWPTWLIVFLILGLTIAGCLSEINDPCAVVHYTERNYCEVEQ